MNKNTEYELLVQNIYQELANEKAPNTVNVQHNVKVEGKSGQKHQIDVYYEFGFMGETHRVIIECKNYSNPVSVGKIRDFHGLLTDIGEVKGIFVSKNGFQSGAIGYAKQYDIVLKELRRPTAEDWKNSITTVFIKMSCCISRVTKREFEFDWAWVKEKYGEKSVRIHAVTDTVNMTINKKNGEQITNLYLLECKLDCFKDETTHGLTQTFSFDDDTYVHIPNYEPFKITAVKFEYDAVIFDENIKIDIETMAGAIMVDVLSDERRLYRKDQLPNCGVSL